VDSDDEEKAQAVQGAVQGEGSPHKQPSLITMKRRVHGHHGAAVAFTITTPGAAYFADL